MSLSNSFFPYSLILQICIRLFTWSEWRGSGNEFLLLVKDYLGVVDTMKDLL